MSDSKTAGILSLLKKDVILAGLRKGERTDGRSLYDYRNIEIKTSYVGKAEGSALVKLGETKVIAGVKIDVGTPFPDTPDKGVQIVNAELIPLASALFEPGPPGEEDIELARVIDRGLRSAEAIDMSRLVLIPGMKVWTVFIDIYPLDYDGNLIDASGLAAMSAILDTKMPVAEVKEGNIVLSEERKPLPINTRVVYVTLAKISDFIIVDPTFEEELVADARLTFAIDEDKNICGIQKGGSGSFKVKEIMDAKNVALEIADRLFEELPPPPPTQ